MRIANCFVIMSFAEELQATYEAGVKKPIQQLGLRCNRYDELKIPGEIYAGVIDQIKRSFIVVADLSTDPPNCYYELGFAHALGWKDNVILLRKKGTPPPFNVTGYNIIYYSSAEDLEKKLVRVVRRSFLSTEETQHSNDTCRGRFGGKAISDTRVLTARFDDRYTDDDGDRVYDIQVQVEALPGAPQLTGDVQFFLHSSYGKKPRVVAAENGSASCVVSAVGGAFTVGAVADAGETRLEFDLGRLPAAERSFYDPSQQHGRRSAPGASSGRRRRA